MKTFTDLQSGDSLFIVWNKNQHKSGEPIFYELINGTCTGKRTEEHHYISKPWEVQDQDTYIEDLFDFECKFGKSSRIYYPNNDTHLTASVHQSQYEDEREIVYMEIFLERDDAVRYISEKLKELIVAEQNVLNRHQSRMDSYQAQLRDLFNNEHGL